MFFLSAFNSLARLGLAMVSFYISYYRWFPLMYVISMLCCRLAYIVTSYMYFKYITWGFNSILLPLVLCVYVKVDGFYVFARYFAKITKGFSLLLSINMVVVCENKAKTQNCNRKSRTYTDNSTVSSLCCCCAAMLWESSPWWAVPLTRGKTNVNINFCGDFQTQMADICKVSSIFCNINFIF